MPTTPTSSRLVVATDADVAADAAETSTAAVSPLLLLERGNDVGGSFGSGVGGGGDDDEEDDDGVDDDGDGGGA
eukprot:5054706-Pyramimonas_sp.AAC.1